MQCWGVQGDYDPIPVASAEGCWITTMDGRRIFDLRSAHECINLGFRHPKVLDALKRQMDSVVYVTDDFATEPTARLAAELAQRTPGSPNKRVWFGQSGADAVEAALRGARLYISMPRWLRGESRIWSRRRSTHIPYKIIARNRSWHGATVGAASAGGDPRRWFVEPSVMPGVVHGPDAFCYRCALGHTYPECGLACAAYLDHLIEMEGGGSRVAALIIEPVVGSNCIIPPPLDYLRTIRDICTKHDILLIADETMTGMGRTGEFLAVNHYGIEPDIIVMGKALGAYCPLTATIFSERVSAAFETNVFGHGQSYSGHALACAGGLASLQVLDEEGLIQRSAEQGAYLGERLRDISAVHPSVGDVRGLGLFWTLDLVKDSDTREPLKGPTEKYKQTVVSDIARFLMEEKNIYIPSDKFGVWIVPPLVVSRDELDFVVDAIDEALVLADRMCGKQQAI